MTVDGNAEVGGTAPARGTVTHRIVADNSERSCSLRCDATPEGGMRLHFEIDRPGVEVNEVEPVNLRDAAELLARAEMSEPDGFDAQFADRVMERIDSEALRHMLRHGFNTQLLPASDA